MGEDQEPTEFSGFAEADTMSTFAWAEEAVEEEPSHRAGWITLAAVTVAVFLIAGAVVLAVTHLGGSAPSVAVTSTTVVAAPPAPKIEPKPAPPPPVTVSTVVVTPEARAADNPDYTASQMKRFDDRFVSTMQANGWQINDRDLMTLRAHQVCVDFAQGNNQAGISQKLIGLGLSPHEATSFLNGVMQSYPDCP